MGEGDGAPWFNIHSNELVDGSPFVKVASGAYIFSNSMSALSSLFVIIAYFKLRPRYSIWTFVFWLMCVGFLQSLNNLCLFVLHLFGTDHFLVVEITQALWYVFASCNCLVTLIITLYHYSPIERKWKWLCMLVGIGMPTVVVSALWASSISGSYNSNIWCTEEQIYQVWIGYCDPLGYQVFLSILFFSVFGLCLATLIRVLYIRKKNRVRSSVLDTREPVGRDARLTAAETGWNKITLFIATYPLCWGPQLFAYYLYYLKSIIPYSSPGGEAIIFMAAFLTPLQGLFNAIIFGFNVNLKGYIRAKFATSQRINSDLRYTLKPEQIRFLSDYAEDSREEEEEDGRSLPSLQGLP